MIIDVNIITIIACTIIILAGLYLFSNSIKNNSNNSANAENAIFEAITSKLATLETYIKSAEEKSKENYSMFSDFQSMLTNRQVRGAHHEKEMETLLKDRLPNEFLNFQKTLSNGKRVDCLVDFKEHGLKFCIDSKSVHESFDALHQAKSEEEKRKAEKFFADDVLENAKKISQDYIIPGYTADYAIMFVRSESVFRGIHDISSIDLMSKLLELRVIVASPTYLWALINNLKEFLKDKDLVENAKKIKKEISAIKDDILKLASSANEIHKKFDAVSKEFRTIHRMSESIEEKTNQLNEISNETIHDNKKISNEG